MSTHTLPMRAILLVIAACLSTACSQATTNPDDNMNVPPDEVPNTPPPPSNGGNPPPDTGKPTDCLTDALEQPPSNGVCSCRFADCSGTISCQCSAACYSAMPPPDCLFTVGMCAPDGTCQSTPNGALDGYLGSHCPGAQAISCTEENDLTTYQECSVSDCQVDVNVIDPPAAVANPSAPVNEPMTNAPPPALCMVGDVNNEPEILAAYYPGPGETVGAGGQIKVWVTDENAACTGWHLNIGPTGLASGYSDIAADGFPFVALYMGPNFADVNGTPYFPNEVLGDYNNNNNRPYPAVTDCEENTVTGYIPGLPPQPTRTLYPIEEFNTLYTWNVDDLHLACGSYTAQFVIWDGDGDRGIGCINIGIACP